MKKSNILKTLLIATVFLFTGILRAQVIVVATAATMGPTPYPSLRDAFNAINAGTHQGSIGVAIMGNTTETGPCVLNSSGAGSAIYTAIGIGPGIDGVTVACNTASGRGIIELNGADNVTIDGDNPNTAGINRNLTFLNTASNTVSFTSCVRIASSTLINTNDNIVIRNCNLTGSGTGRNTSLVTAETVTWGVIASGNASTTLNTDPPTGLSSATTTIPSPQTITNLQITNNNIQTVSRGISINGAATTTASGLLINNNIIGNATVGAVDQVYAIGLTVSGSANAIIAGNTLYLEGYMASSSLTHAMDIGIISANSNGFTIEKNNIERVINNNQESWSAFGINLAGGNNHIIRNNFIGTCKQSQVAGTGAFSTTFGVFGIRILTGTGHVVYHNTIHFTGVVPGSVNTSLQACIGIISTASTGMNIRNNIFSNQLTGGNPASFSTTFACVYMPTGGSSTMNLTWNNNAYYEGNGTTYSCILQRGTTGGTGFFTAANFNPASTAPATNSRSYTSTLSTAGTNDNLSYASSNAPPLISATNLHIDLSSPEMVNVEQKGDASVAVTTDIDNDPRPNASTTLPDMGADEVAATNCSSASGGTISPSSQTVCAGQTIVMTSTGATVGTGITYQWQVGTTSGGPYSNVVGGSGATTTSYTTGTLSAGTYYYVLATTCSAGPTTGLSNQVTVTVNALPVITVSPASSTYCVGSPAIALTASGGLLYSWSPSYGLSATSGATVNASPDNIMTYTVTSIDANGCVGSGTAYINASTAPTGVTASVSQSAICLGDQIDLSSTVSAVTTVLAQDFTNGLGGWTVTSAPSSPVATHWASVASPFNWVIGSLNFVNFSTPNAGNFYMTNSDAGGSGSTTNTVLTSPVFSTVGMTSASLSFEHLYQRWASGDVLVAVEISTDGGATWSTFQAYTSDQGVITGGSQVATTATLSLAAYLNQSNLRVRYNYVAVWGYYWILDNIRVTGSTTNTFAWTSNPVGFTSAVQNPTGIIPTASADYIVAVTNPQGCSTSATVNSVVNALPTVVANTTASAVCDGDPVTLTGSGATSYTWTGSVTDNVAFNPSTTDTYTVTGTDANGCINTDNITVTVNPLPAVVANASSTAICIGDQVTLTGSGATSYTWTNSVIDGVPFSPTITDVYTVTGTDANGCQNTDNTSVTVNTLPTVVANATATAVCDGSPVTLFGSGAVSFAWTGSVSDNVAFTPLITDTYTVTGTDGNGCTNTDMITVTVNPLPVVTLTGNSSFCAGDSSLLSGTPNTMNQWYMNGTPVTGATAGSYYAIAAGVYNMTEMDANGCTDSSAVGITVTENALPSVTANASASTACVGSPVTFTGGGATSYTWTGGVTNAVPFTIATTNTYTVTGIDANGCMNTASVMVTANPLPTVTATIPQASVCVDDGNLALTGGSPAGGTWSGTGVTGTSFDPTTVGNVTITYTFTDANGCTNSATDVIAVNACTGIITVDAVADVTIYPNPNEGQFTIQLPAVPTTSVQIEVMNGLGQVIDAFMMTATTKEVNISQYEGGVYFVRVINGNSISVHRVVKQ